jgi:alkanesulfonate monooxygenase SsuD/methylene tetrahydromethanopterin reductase-like flavin-dependent oxidoreductase (luciferase family)
MPVRTRPTDDVGVHQGGHATNGRMRYGYFMMPMHLPGSDVGVTLQTDLAQIERLDTLGFDEAWIGEHFTAEWENIPAPDIFIGAALQRTRSIKLGTGVSCLPNHNPFHLAHRIAMLDQLAQGRFFWGIGSGGFPGDFEVVGIDPKSGAQRQVSVDTVDAVLALWSDPLPGAYAQHGWVYNVPVPDARIRKHVYLKPFQKPHPPIAVAGVTEKSETLGLAGERGWIPMSINFVTPRVLRSHWDSITAGAARTGRTADRAEWRICRAVHVAETDEQARREALDGTLGRDYRDYFLPLLSLNRGLGGLKLSESMADSEITLDYLCDNVWLVGSPETVARKIMALYDSVGGFGGILIGATDWPDPAIWDRCMTLFASEVMPRMIRLAPSAPQSVSVGSTR